MTSEDKDDFEPTQNIGDEEEFSDNNQQDTDERVLSEEDRNRNKDFSPTQSAKDDKSDEYLNRKTRFPVSNKISKSFITIVIAIGFTVGFLIGSTLLSGVICTTEEMSTLFGGVAPGAGGLDEENPISGIEGNIMSCSKSRILTLEPIIAGIIGGVILAYPTYTYSSNFIEDKNLDSLV